MSIASIRGIDATAESVISALLEGVGQGLLWHDAGGRIVIWNRAAERIFGRAAVDVIGGPLGCLFSDALRDEINSLAEAACNGERFDRLLFDVGRPDGMQVPIALTLSPVEGRAGGVAGFVSVVDELTETRQAQATLAEVEARFQEWESLAHVGRWLWDVGTDSVQWSLELHRLHGVEPSEFDGTLEGHLICVHPDDRSRIRDQMQYALQHGNCFDDAYRVQRRGGTFEWLELRAEPTFGSSGLVVGLRGVTRGRSHLPSDASSASPAAGDQPDPLEQI